MAKYSVSYVYEIVDKYSKTIDKISRKTKQFAHDAAKATTSAAVSFQKFGKTLRNVGYKMAVGVSTPIALIGRSMINAASDAEETRSKYATIFKSMGIDAENTADKFAQSFGLAGSTSRKLLGDTGDMLSGFGFTADAALKLSERTNALAVDLASFTNYSGGAEGASAALTKALLGERESVKSLGIAILESDVKKKVTEMRSRGIRYATEREAKAYATLEIAISQSKNAIGDYARTKDSFANTQRRVMQRNLELRESFGRLLLPAATKFLNVIGDIQEKLISTSPATKKVILAVAGLLAVIAPLLIILGTIGLVAPAVVTGFWLMVAAISALVSPVGLAIAAIAGLVYGFKWAWKYNEKFRNGVIAMGETVKGVFSSIKETLSPIFDWLFGNFERVFNFIKGAGGKLLEKAGFDFNVSNNPAAEGAANNTLNGSIDITAKNATVNKADFSANNNPIPANMAGSR